MKRLTQLVLIGVLLLVGLSIATAQTPQPVVRLGNYIEVGNDLFMHIIATADQRYKTVHNLDFEGKIRDQTTSRSPSSTAQHETEGDLFYAEVRFGADFRYQKSLTFHLLFENQFVFDGNLIDDRSNGSNPGGTDVFGRGPSTENPGFRVERFWARYQFAGTPLSLFVGAELYAISQAGILGNDDPGIKVEAEFGDLKLYARAMISRESQRIGLQNDNDLINYMFGGTYDLKPHRFGLDVVYMRDRFFGADTRVVSCDRADMGCTGQKIDAVWVNLSWTGRVGPVRGLVQGNIVAGTARGGTGNLPGVVPLGRDYDIFAGAVVAYAEADLGIVRPFIGLIYGSGDGDPRDDKLHGFQTQTVGESTQITGTGFFNHLDKSTAFGGTRDYSCPARMRRARADESTVADPYAIGARVVADGGASTTTGAFAECYHTVGNVFNSRIGNESHVGINVSYSNPGTLVIPVGLKVFPVKGHEITGWYVYRAMLSANLLEVAFAPEIAAGQISGIGKGLYHELGGFWMWTLNPHFDIRLSGNVGIPTGATKDLARLADCDPVAAGRQACQGDDLALKAEARFRARF